MKKNIFIAVIISIGCFIIPYIMKGMEKKLKGKEYKTISITNDYKANFLKSSYKENNSSIFAEQIKDMENIQRQLVEETKRMEKEIKHPMQSMIINNKDLKDFQLLFNRFKGRKYITKPNRYIIKLNIPKEIAKKNIKIVIENNIIIINVNNVKNTFQESIPLPLDANINEISSSYKNHILTILVPRKKEDKREIIIR